MRHSIRALFVVLSLAAPAGVLAAQDSGTSREQKALSDEQSLILRKLSRLRASMERLAERYEAEGRVHASGLLRDALKHLDERAQQRSNKTLDELMNDAESGLTAGQLVQAIEDQEAIVADLQRLLSILMDRPDLDQLENELERLQERMRRLEDLAGREQQLRDRMQELREQSKNDAQRALETLLGELAQAQRELLTENEREAREAGDLRREALEARLSELLADQETDLAVARSWKPEHREQLAALLSPLETAGTETARADRLEAASERLRELSAAAESDDEDALRAAIEAAEAAAEREERHARAGQDPAARKAADALREAAQAAREGRTDDVEALAQDLERAAAERRNAADAERERARDAARDGEAATPALQEALERAAERGDAESTSEALEALRRALDEQRLLGQALAGSQQQNAERAEQLADSLERAESPAAATEALQRAAEAMRRASEEAARNEAGETATSADEAREALQQALSDLETARRERGASKQELAERQAQLAERSAELDPKAQDASLSESAREEVRREAQAAREAMERAAEALREGRSGDAAAEQRAALEALQRAARESEAGTEPRSEEARERAQEIAEAQEEIERKLYQFRKALEEQGETPSPALESAQEHAKQSAQEMSQGELSKAEQEAERTQREIEEALDEMKEEERQYQRLRDEELLFKIAEEVAGMIETNERLATETNELDADRAPGDPASRVQKLRLRKLSREVQAVADRAAELRGAIAEEGSAVFAELFQRIEDDLLRIVRSTGETGGYRSGPRVQALFDDVDRDLRWLLSALEEEKNRREQEGSQPEQQGGPQEGQQPENRLVPDVAELKLLQRMERDVLDGIDELLVLYPELKEGGDVDPLLLEEISRLAQRHRRTSQLFSTFRERLGLPDPEGGSDTQ